MTTATENTQPKEAQAATACTCPQCGNKTPMSPADFEKGERLAREESEFQEEQRAEAFKTKIELLMHYAEKEPTAFRQFDAFGDDLFWGETFELMNGADVRVLIKPDVSANNAVRALLRIAIRVREIGAEESARNATPNDASSLPF